MADLRAAALQSCGWQGGRPVQPGGRPSGGRMADLRAVGWQVYGRSDGRPTEGRFADLCAAG